MTARGDDCCHASAFTMPRAVVGGIIPSPAREYSRREERSDGGCNVKKRWDENGTQGREKEQAQLAAAGPRKNKGQASKQSIKKKKEVRSIGLSYYVHMPRCMAWHGMACAANNPEATRTGMISTGVRGRRSWRRTDNLGTIRLRRGPRRTTPSHPAPGW